MTSTPNKGNIDMAFIDAMAAREPGGEAEDLSQRFVIGEKTPRFEHNEFAKYMMDEEDFATPRDSGELLIYEEGVYKPQGATFVKERIDHIMDGMLSTLRGKSETLGHITSRTYVDRDVFDSDEDIINLNNGLYHVSTGEFTPHTPGYMSLRKSAVNYAPAAKCPNIDKFIRESVEPRRVDTIYEMAGYALMTRKKLKRGFILLGQPDTGKTQMLKMFHEFVGHDATCGVGPVALGRDSHAGSEMVGKMLNLVDDLGTTPLTETGNIKSVIGDAPITCNPKGVTPYQFNPHVLVVWGCNQIPKTDDQYIRDKFDVIEFNNIFGGHAKADPNLFDKLTTKEELSGFFNKAMGAVKKAIERGGFSGSEDATGRRRVWLNFSTPISRYINEECSLDDETALWPVKAFDKSYKSWLIRVGATKDKKREIVEHLEDVGVFKTKVTSSSDGARNTWCYLGIRPQEYFE